MFTSIMFGLSIGIVLGIITGLIPGIHVNLISLILLSLSTISPLFLTIVILATAMTNSFVNAIPAIYLGAPDVDHAILPGHKLLLSGKGHQAVLATVVGSIGAFLFCFGIFWLLLMLIEEIYPVMKEIIGFLLLCILCYLIFRGKWYQNIVLLAMSGCLGLVVLNFPNLNQPLFPLLSGLFGVSGLLGSLFSVSSCPEQQEGDELSCTNKELGATVVSASGIGFFAGMLPGLGNAQSAIIGATLFRNISMEGFLLLLGGLNTANMFVSLATFYVLAKARNGAIVAIQKVLEALSIEGLLLLLCSALFVAGCATLLTITFSRKITSLLPLLPYQLTCVSVIILIVLLVFLFDGLIGLLILGTATALGLCAFTFRLGKHHLMGCLLIPVLKFFLFA